MVVAVHLFPNLASPTHLDITKFFTFHSFNKYSLGAISPGKLTLRTSIIISSVKASGAAPAKFAASAKKAESLGPMSLEPCLETCDAHECKNGSHRFSAGRPVWFRLLQIGLEELGPMLTVGLSHKGVRREERQ